MYISVLQTNIYINLVKALYKYIILHYKYTIVIDNIYNSYKYIA